MTTHTVKTMQISGDVESFWEIGQYKRCVKRIEDAHSLCSDLMQMIHDRSEIEKSYAKSLKAFSKKWDDRLVKGPEYGSMMRAWSALLTQAEQQADVHITVRDNLMEDVHQQVKNWQKEKFHKALIGFKEAKVIEDEFKKAQKPWAKLYEKVDKTKKEYHGVCKAMRSTQIQQNNAKSDASQGADHVVKLEQKLEKLEQFEISTREKYESALKCINDSNSRYMEDMSLVFKKCQSFEEQRLTFFKNIFLDIHKRIDLAAVPGFANTYRVMEQKVSQTDAIADLNWWSDKYGENMNMKWPAFEGWSPELKQIMKRERTQRMDSVQGITLKRHTVYSDVPVHSESLRLDSAHSPVHSPVHSPTYDSREINSVHIASAHMDPSDNTFKTPVALEPHLNGSAGSSLPSVSQHENPFDDDDEEEDDDEFFKDDGRPGVPVVAIYDYQPVEDDELTLIAGDRFEKLEDEDEKGWCKGRKDGKLGLYPANYVELA